MALSPKVAEKLKRFTKPAIFIYPLVIIIAIPLLLVLNTYWNLKSFNRDVNFVIRHQAVSTADTLKPVISENIENPEKLDSLLVSAVNSNSEILSAALLVKKDKELEVVSSTNPQNATEEVKLGLNQLALGFNQPFAGLNYDPNLGKNVWNVVVPLEIESTDTYLLSIKLQTDTVNEILSRTSRDSIIVLVVLIIVTLILLANHFLFYRRAMKAKQLAELDKLKDEFLSMAAHELKAPIAGLIGYLDLLKDKISPSQLPSVQSDLNILGSLTIDLRSLINDLLDVSRIEQGHIKVSITNVQVNDVITKVINTLAPTAQEKSLAIKFTPISLPAVQTDPDRLRQVITNLISNSIKYTLKGEINISAKVKSKTIEVEVGDTGIGIPPDQLPNLFSKFHRVKDEQTKEVRGTGLGLWITKQMVELLGGKIYVESIYGTGTRITFTLPLGSIR